MIEVECGKTGKKTDNDGMKIGLHSSWTQHSFSYTNDILYRVYRVRLLVVLHRMKIEKRKHGRKGKE